MVHMILNLFIEGESRHGSLLLGLSCVAFVLHYSNGPVHPTIEVLSFVV